MDRRDFVKTSAATAVAAAAPSALAAEATRRAPQILRRSASRPIVVSDVSSIRFKNGGPESGVERAFRGITEGEDVLDALVAGVNIPELDPAETGIGYGGLPNADGVVQLDSCCMHGPRRWAGGVAALEGVRTPSLVAKAVMELTDHHLLVGHGAREFARQVGFEIEEDLNTEESRALWLEWRRRIDPEHWLEPDERLRRQRAPGGEPDAGVFSAREAVRARSGRIASGRYGSTTPTRAASQVRADAFYRAGLDMVREGLIPEHSFWGTTNCNAVTPNGDVAGVTTTSGLAWKIPGRVGDSPILGAGLYVDNDVGAAGSTGRGEANLYNLTSFLIVEQMRGGLSPKDAGMEALRRIVDNTVEPRLQNSRVRPAFNVRFFIVNKDGEYAGVSLYDAGERTFAVCDQNGAREEPLEALLEGEPTD